MVYFKLDGNYSILPFFQITKELFQTSRSQDWTFFILGPNVLNSLNITSSYLFEKKRSWNQDEITLKIIFRDKAILKNIWQ